MRIEKLLTPSFLLDLDLLQNNIMEMARIARTNKKELWPMIKTHKSSRIAKMQSQAGAQGFLTGTIDEAQKLIEAGLENIMLAYPVAGTANIERIITLGRRANLIAALDGGEAADALNSALRKRKQRMDYLLIIDCGFQRLGVSPGNALGLIKELEKYERLSLRGICTHPGQVYASLNLKEVELVAEEEENALQKTRGILEENNIEVQIVATGSTPTVKMLAGSELVTVLRPGNYVFYDQLQKSLGIVGEDRCALTVLATVISNPRQNQYIMDAGSKVLGLDQGAHGVSLVKGFGQIKGYPGLTITGLSEEVGKIEANKDVGLRVGQKIRIIPNHACSTANNTSYFIGCRQGKAEEIIEVDLRGGSCQRSHFIGEPIWKGEGS